MLTSLSQITQAALFLAAATMLMPPPRSAHRAYLTIHLDTHLNIRRTFPAHPNLRRWLLIILGASGGGAAVVLLSPATLATGALIVVVTLIRRRRRRQHQLRHDEGRILAAALETLAGELSVGAHPVHALNAASIEATGTVGIALRTVAARARLGADVGAGFMAMAQLSTVPIYWERLAICWQLAIDHGLALSTLIGTAYRDIVQRQRFTDQVEAGLAGARATAGILALLPILGIALGELMGAKPIAFLIGGGTGSGFLFVGVLLLSAGLIWADRITDRSIR